MGRGGVYFSRSNCTSELSACFPRAYDMQRLPKASNASKGKTMPALRGVCCVVCKQAYPAGGSYFVCIVFEHQSQAVATSTSPKTSNAILRTTSRKLHVRNENFCCECRDCLRCRNYCQSPVPFDHKPWVEGDEVEPEFLTELGYLRATLYAETDAVKAGRGPRNISACFAELYPCFQHWISMVESRSPSLRRELRDARGMLAFCSRRAKNTQRPPPS